MPFNLFPSPCCAQRRQSVICPTLSEVLDSVCVLTCPVYALLLSSVLVYHDLAWPWPISAAEVALGWGRGCLPSLLCHQVLISSCMVAHNPIIPGPERCRQGDETLQVIFSQAVSSRSDQFGTQVTFESWNSSASSPNSGGVKLGWYSWLCSP